MLPAEARLHTAAEFARATRRGSRGVASSLVVHLYGSALPRRPRAGFVVSKKVGGAVVRNRVTRRLRPLVRQRLPGLPDGSDLVVRALPVAAGVDSRHLAMDLDAALGTAVDAARSRGRRRQGR